jgi:predicted nucleic acid-binding protein
MSTSSLFDASALVNLLVSRGSGAFEIVRGNDVLDLTIYEAGNALWKLSTLRKEISPAQADALLKTLLRTMREQMRLVRVTDIDHMSVASLARSERISYYDAAYISAAKEGNQQLITDDERLASVGSRFVRVKPSADL